jgi:hypothetical protein
VWGGWSKVLIKIAVYGVAKNEEDNVKSWYESTQNADYHFILDTGSTDKTIQVAKSFGINVVSASFIPWDETLAKNVALSLLPRDIDYCVMMDLDQKMQSSDWKEQLINNNAQDYDVVEHRLIDNIDLVNQDLNDISRRSIHNRKNSYWHKYRPSIDFHSKEIKVLTLPIYIENIIGTEERFTDREIIYQDSWEREYVKLKKYNKEVQDGYLAAVVARQAFNFYERDFFDQYIDKYREFMDSYIKLDDRHKAGLFEIYSTFILANALLFTEKAESILKTMPSNSTLFKNAEFKLKIIEFWKNGKFKDELSKYTENDLVSLYSDTKTGKYKIKLGLDAYKYYGNIDSKN